MAIVAMATALLWGLAPAGFGARLSAAATPLALAAGAAAFAFVVAGVALWRARVATRNANRIGMLIAASGLADRPTAKPLAEDAPRPELAPDADPLTVMLQPVVALSRNVAIGYDAVFDGEGAVKPRADRRRIEAVVEAMALRPRELGAGAPVFVAVSAAFLADPATRPFLAALVRGKPNVAAGLRLCVAEKNGRMVAAADLACVGVSLAWCGSTPRIDAAALAEQGVTHWRIPAAALLDSQSARRLPALQAAETAVESGMAVIATDVASRQDAARLLELGIDLMAGSGIAPPLRLRTVDDQATDIGEPGRRIAVNRR